jgi:nitrogen regulatory protein PII-like uncharacterized protein
VKVYIIVEMHFLRKQMFCFYDGGITGFFARMTGGAGGAERRESSISAV